ncbi:MAG: ribonuclease Z [Nanoarchaeota archaeon]
MELTFLGTAAMMPTRDRNHPAVYLKFKGEGILFDCGEGTQRQFRTAGLKPTAITMICISHWHGDHVLGLPGLLQTLRKSEYQGTLVVIGPVGTKKKMAAMYSWLEEGNDLSVDIKEVTKGVAYDSGLFMIEVLPLEHPVPTIGFRFIEKDRRRINLVYTKKLGIPEGPILGDIQDGKSVSWKGKRVDIKKATYPVEGKKIAYFGDTGMTKNAIVLAEDVDLLISEATFGGEHQEKAEAYQHLTAEDAAKIANLAGAKKLVLTHFSQRYKELSQQEEEVKRLFPESVLAYDFLRIKV